jgi:hypothetical protein
MVTKKVETMSKRIESMVKRIRYLEGQRDCILGVAPKKTSRYYLLGYSEQYASEQEIDFLNEETSEAF